MPSLSLTVFEIITALVGFISIGLVGVQVHYAAKALREDHSRRRQQATLDYLVRDVRPHWREELRTLTRSFGNVVPMSEEAMNSIRQNPQSKQLISKLLGNIEHMAVGVNMGVFDIETLDRASGGFMIRTFNQFLPYIRKRQLKQPSIYSEFEALAIELCKRRGRPLPQLAPPQGTTVPLQSTGASDA